MIMIKWPEEFSRIVNCQLCDLSKDKVILRDSDQNVPQPGYIGTHYKKSGILLIGQNPGVGNSVSENKAQRYLSKLHQIRDNPLPNVYRELQQILSDLIPTWPVHGKYFPLNESHLNLDEIAYTNVVRCRTQDNKAPSVKMLRNCSDHLKNWLKLINPRAIVFIGKWASDKGAPIVDELGIPHKYINRLRSLNHMERQKNRLNVLSFVRNKIG